MNYQQIFKRYEIKYLLSMQEKEFILDIMKPYMKLDKYGHSTIRNVYFDTDTFRLIRRSLEKPVYKEKLRVRSYKAAKENDNVFVELKKKYKEMTEKYTSAAGREGKLKNEIEQMEAHIHILVTLANKVTREFTHPLAKHEITRQYKEIGKTLGVENAPGNYIEIFRRAMPKEYITDLPNFY